MVRTTDHGLRTNPPVRCLSLCWRSPLASWPSSPLLFRSGHRKAGPWLAPVSHARERARLPRQSTEVPRALGRSWTHCPGGAARLSDAPGAVSGRLLCATDFPGRLECGQVAGRLHVLCQRRCLAPHRHARWSFLFTSRHPVLELDGKPGFLLDRYADAVIVETGVGSREGIGQHRSLDGGSERALLS